MKVIDARSGKVMMVGDTVQYGDGESVTLLDVKPGLLEAWAKVRHQDNRVLVVPLQVRWTHPSYFLQHVGFIPS